MHKLIPFGYLGDGIDSVTAEGCEENQYIDVGLHSEGHLAEYTLWYKDEPYKCDCKGREKVKYKIENGRAVIKTQVDTFIYYAANH